MLDRDKLAKILGLLGSDKVGEIVSAAQAADALIRKANTSWAEVLNPSGVADDAREDQVEVFGHDEIAGRMPALSISTMPCAPGATACPSSARKRFVAVVSSRVIIRGYRRRVPGIRLQ